MTGPGLWLRVYTYMVVPADFAGPNIEMQLNFMAMNVIINRLKIKRGIYLGLVASFSRIWFGIKWFTDVLICRRLRRRLRRTLLADMYLPGRGRNLNCPTDLFDFWAKYGGGNRKLSGNFSCRFDAFLSNRLTIFLRLSKRCIRESWMYAILIAEILI